MPLHVVAMALVICASLFVIFSDVVSSGDASLWTLDFVISATLILGVGARVAVHRWEDRVKAQQLGAVAWMITTVTALTADVMAGTQGQAHACCQSSALPVLPLICALCALVNATHGMEFWHTNLPTGLMFCDLATWRMACGDLLAINLAFVLLVVVHAFCHFNTLLSRHAFLETDYLHTSRERLEYDFQRLECGLHRLEAKLPAVVAGGSAPTESSESTSTAPGRAPRSTQSAPATIMRGGRPAPEEGHRDQSPSVMRCAGAAQPHAGSSANGHASEAPSTSYATIMPPTPLSRLARRCRWSAETLDRADTASSSSASSTFTRDKKMRRKMRQLRRDIVEAEESARDIAIRRCPYI